MTFWLLASVALLALLILMAFLVPVSLSSSLQGRAEPSGSWAVAFGLGLGPIALSAIAAAGVAPFVTCHVFGRQLARLPLSRWLHRTHKADSGEPKPAAPPATWSRLEHSGARFLRSLDPLETVLSWWEKERVFRVRSLVVDVEYSFRDVALTGRILAGLYVLSAVLPEHWQINQTPSWESEDRLSLAADARFRIWPGRLLIDLTRFVLKQRSRARQSAEPASE
ncbi:MAG TPA: hypothetical protein VHW01_06045 [Polyangiaceae bacterium]|nr:hypothetical protein [Polyangiaceae bacterium]